ncbi:putative plant self-incompatibility S1 [Helianthus anomalus]
MDKAMRCLALLLFLVAPPCCLASPPPPPSPSPPIASWKHVLHIIDKDLKDLNFLCEEVDDLLDDYTLQPGQKIKLDVAINSLYDCRFKWQSREKMVFVFDDGLISDCVGGFVKDCTWEVRTDGFWLYDNKKHWVKKDHW